MRTRTHLPVVLALTLALGCSADDRCFVEGRVTDGGKPVTPAQIGFFNQQQGLGASAEMDDAGNYKIAGALKPAIYVVTVNPPPAPEPPPENLKTYPVPTRFLSHDATPLKVKLKAGQNRFDVDLQKP